MGVNHRICGASPPEFKLEDSNANCPEILYFQHWRTRLLAFMERRKYYTPYIFKVHKLIISGKKFNIFFWRGRRQKYRPKSPTQVKNSFFSGARDLCPSGDRYPLPTPAPHPQPSILSGFAPGSPSIPAKKGKGFPYSLPSVGPGAYPSVQEVSPQVT